MIASDILLYVKRQFGDEYDVLITNNDVFGWIHEAQLDIIRRTGDNQQSVVTTVNAFPVSVPDQVNIRRVSMAGKALVNISREELDLQQISTENTGAPRFWYKQGTQVRLYPMDTADTREVTIAYSKVPTIITSVGANLSVPERYHTDIVHYCLARAHNRNENYNGEKVEMEHYERSVGYRQGESQTADTGTYKLPDPLDFEFYG